MDPRQHVNPGDPIRLAASQINGLNRLLNLTGGFSAPAAVEQPTPYTWVMAKNNGPKIDRWGVLAITGMDITPGSSQAATGQFEQLPVVAGDTPDATTTAWCVAVEPIASGSVGRVAVGGVVQLKASDLGKATGAQVLWKDSNWALVRLQSGIVRGTFTGGWEKDATATVTDAVNTGTTYSDVKNYLTSITGTGEKDCLIAYVGEEWVLVQFDLLQLDGYSAGQSQVLGTESGSLKWIDTTECETTTP